MTILKDIQDLKVSAAEFFTVSKILFNTFFWTHVLVFVLLVLFDEYSLLGDIKDLLFGTHFGLLTKQEDLNSVLTSVENFRGYWFIREIVSFVIASVITVGVWILLRKTKSEDVSVKAGAKVQSVKALLKICEERAKEIIQEKQLPKEERNQIANFLPAVVFEENCVPITNSELVRNFFILGAPGSGKTNFLNWNLLYLGKTIVHDFKGDFLERFYYSERDYILNPYDARCVKWTIFNEIEIPSIDIPELANSLIPPTANSNIDPFWTNASRDIFEAILRICYKTGKTTNADVWKMLCLKASSLVEIFEQHEEAKALTHISDPTSKQTQGILSHLASATKIFEVLSYIDGDFSLRRWLRDKTKSILFLENMPSSSANLAPVISLFFDFAAKEVLSWSDTTEKVKVTFLLDEFPRLQKMPSIPALLTNGRSKGVSCWICAQSIEGIFARYGNGEARDIVNACSNRFYFWVNDESTAEYVSKTIGDRRVDKVTVNQNFMENREELVLNFNQHETVERAVLPSEIQNLSIGECYFKLKEIPFYAKVKIREFKYNATNKAFILNPIFKKSEEETVKIESSLQSLYPYSTK